MAMEQLTRNSGFVGRFFSDKLESRWVIDDHTMETPPQQRTLVWQGVSTDQQLSSGNHRDKQSSLTA